MEDKQLKDKAIDIKGKKYVLVSDRVLYFNEQYPKGSITTELISNPSDDFVFIKATIKPDEGRTFTGYSQATWDDGHINKTSALENAETSAVGRALAFMGIGVIESIASADELNKAQTQPSRKKVKTMDSQEARKIAEAEIEKADSLDELIIIRTQVSKSPNLDEKDKQELAFVINEKMENYDPTK